MAKSFGYKPKLSTPSFGSVDIFQIVPSVGSGVNNKPNYSYVTNQRGSLVESTTGVTFRIRENVNFSYSSSFDPTVVTTYEVDSSNEVSYYLLKKVSKSYKWKCISEESFQFGSVQKYPRIYWDRQIY